MALAVKTPVVAHSGDAPTASNQRKGVAKHPILGTIRLDYDALLLETYRSTCLVLGAMCACTLRRANSTGARCCEFVI